MSRAQIAAYRETHPWCENCGKPAFCAHHIRTVGSGGHDEAYNLLALCVPCHGFIHAMGVLTTARLWTKLTGKIEAALGRPKEVKGQ